MSSIDERKHGAAVDEAVVLSDVIGVGENAHLTVRVGTWTFTSWFAAGADEPRILDLDLGERLGYERPRDIRKLIERLVRDKKLNDVHVCATVARTQMPAPGGMRETVVDEYWLTEAQALLVAAKSETVKADAILAEMIYVYMLARRGLLPGQQEVALLTRQIKELQATVDSLSTLKATVTALDSTVKETFTGLYTPATDKPFIGSKAAKLHVQGPLMTALMPKFNALEINPQKGDSKELKDTKTGMRKAVHNNYENMLRDAVEFNTSKGRIWARLPMHKLTATMFFINLIAHTIRTELQIPIDLRQKQLDLPGIDDPSKKVH